MYNFIDSIGDIYEISFGHFLTGLKANVECVTITRRYGPSYVSNTVFTRGIDEFSKSIKWGINDDILISSDTLSYINKLYNNKAFF